MDIADLRGLGTLIVAIAFIGLSLWVSSSRRNEDFARARMAPFADEPQPANDPDQPAERSEQP